jgi:hypothetical protein
MVTQMFFTMVIQLLLPKDTIWSSQVADVLGGALPNGREVPRKIGWAESIFWDLDVTMGKPLKTMI